MKRIFTIMILLTLGAFTCAFAQDDVWNYKVSSMRTGKGTNMADSNKDNVKWDSWKECQMSVMIDLDNKNLVIKDGDDVQHSIAFAILDVNTDKSPANVLMSGFDVCWFDLAAIDWYLYKGQSHYLYLFYDSGAAIEFQMKAL